ncbi:phosphoribosylglycinamide formyltransferase [Candidatus Anaplasma sp. TIGMIC]|uniref:phosphoribosylglycinamide formyltransferase n=1 Tax=Candidatus Anaplasma sp. TIGMIC TaxID=3020713 RepID=UPI00232FC3C6|nr:phosphoribosylglycinamide formyltransferase [Candidatus Anaplasma sp. TIGMIC]MDB1135179.1 phosphoribosylglycinamide formyltransferase [Candidatus Anaplasma sp. TIGMIC]
MKIGILISGRGSNFKALAEACASDGFPASVSCVISNNPSAPGLAIADDFGIEAFVVGRRPLDTARITAILREREVDLVCLAGFMSILQEQFVRDWHHKIINIHPSLLPSFKGLRAQEQAFTAGVKIAGCTVHYVYPELDAGPIIMQAAVPVLPSDTSDSLAARILSAEHLCYPKAIRLIAEGKVRIQDNDTIQCMSEDEDLFLFHHG